MVAATDTTCKAAIKPEIFGTPGFHVWHFGTHSAQNLLNYNIRMQENNGLKSCLHFTSLQGKEIGRGRLTE